jgi:hypothetical protein
MDMPTTTLILNVAGSVPTDPTYTELKDLLLPLVAALWALFTILLSGTKELNSLRDRIMFGGTEGVQMTPEHRKLVAENDWRPLIGLMTVASLAFGLVAAISPFLLKPTDQVLGAWILAELVALCAFAMVAVFVFTGISDWREIKKHLPDRTGQPEGAEPSAVRVTPDTD